jgi:hypothetical protein
MRVPTTSFIPSKGKIGETLAFKGSGTHLCRTPWGLRKVDPAVAQAHEYRVFKARLMNHFKMGVIACVAFAVGGLLGATLL